MKALEGIGEMEEFVKTMSDLELVIMRHQAKQVNDTALLVLLDAELRIREKQPTSKNHPPSLQDGVPHAG